MDQTHALEALTAILQQLDTMEVSCTDFEANILESLLARVARQQLPSEKQCRILSQMVERYLDDGPLATMAERLFAPLTLLK